MLFLPSAFFLWPPWSDPCLITHSGASCSRCSLCPASDFSPRRSMPVHKLCLPLPPCGGRRFSPAFLGQPVGQKVVGGRAEFWELWNTGSAWEVMCLRVNCMQRRMCFLRYFLSEAAPSKWLAFSWNVAVFLHQKCYKLIAKLCKKKKGFGRLGTSDWNLTWWGDWELTFWLWGMGQEVVSLDPQTSELFCMGAITSHLLFWTKKCKEKFSMKVHPRTFVFLCGFSKITST